jgi:hypothetical protein
MLKYAFIAYWSTYIISYSNMMIGFYGLYNPVSRIASIIIQPELPSDGNITRNSFYKPYNYALLQIYITAQLISLFKAIVQCSDVQQHWIQDI